MPALILTLPLVLFSPLAVSAGPEDLANLGVAKAAFEDEANFFVSRVQDAVNSGCFSQNEDNQLWGQIRRFESSIHNNVVSNVATVSSGTATPYLGEGESCDTFSEVKGGMDRDIALLQKQISPLQSTASQQGDLARKLNEMRAFRVPTVKCALRAGDLAVQITDSSERLRTKIGNLVKSYGVKLNQLQTYRAKVAGIFQRCGTSGNQAAANTEAQGSAAKRAASKGDSRRPTSTITGVDKQLQNDNETAKLVSPTN